MLQTSVWPLSALSWRFGRDYFTGAGLWRSSVVYLLNELLRET